MTVDVSAVFKQFAGKEIPLIETPRKQVFLGKTYDVLVTRFADDNHPVLAAMENAARENGLTLRLMWPGAAATRDMRSDRVNAYLEKEADGKWRVQNRFHIG